MDFREQAIKDVAELADEEIHSVECVVEDGIDKSADGEGYWNVVVYAVAQREARLRERAAFQKLMDLGELERLQDELWSTWKKRVKVWEEARAALDAGKG